jgi:CelD/BcsL family acetyltransferase involved in cellulose biosynthesis
MDRFARPWIAELVTGLLAANDDCCRGILSVLYDGPRPISAHFGLRSGGTISYWFPAYDMSYARYSPGLGLFFKMAEESSKLGVRRIDLGKGDEPYKDLLANDSIELAAGSLSRPSTLAVVRQCRHATVRSLDSYIRNRPVLRRYARSALDSFGALRVRLDEQGKKMHGRPLR